MRKFIVYCNVLWLSKKGTHLNIQNKAKELSSSVIKIFDHKFIYNFSLFYFIFSVMCTAM